MQAEIIERAAPDGDLTVARGEPPLQDRSLDRADARVEHLGVRLVTGKRSGRTSEHRDGLHVRVPRRDSDRAADRHRPVVVEHLGVPRDAVLVGVIEQMREVRAECECRDDGPHPERGRGDARTDGHRGGAASALQGHANPGRHRRGCTRASEPLGDDRRPEKRFVGRPRRACDV